MATDYELFTRETVPAFYLQLPSDDPAMIAALVAAGRRAPEDVLLQMLRTDAWRDRKVGAWLAISRPGPAVTAAVLESLRTSRGTYTAFSLAVAAIELAGAGAVPALQEYGHADVENGWYGAGFISEALVRVGSASPFTAASERDVALFASHIATATAIASSTDT